MAVAGSGPAAAPQTASKKTTSTAGASDTLPPLSYVCPMPGDEDVIEDKPGKCPKCGMVLDPIRLDSVWTCPVHAAVTKEQPGKCPIDGRQLVPMTMAVSWACPGGGGAKDSLTPGRCSDGTPMVKKFTQRAHGNHNPQHGGAFFMAPDNWHHLEGAYFQPGVFRLYLYDDFTRPLKSADIRAAQARVILTKDGKEFPLVRNGQFMEARVGSLPFPAVMQARIRFKPDAPEHLFDFTFEQFATDLPARVTPAPTPTGAPLDTPTPSEGAATSARPAAANNTAPATDVSLLNAPVAETVPEMLNQLRGRNNDIKALIERGAFASVYVPAFQAKDVALALDARKSELPVERQKIIGSAVSELVRTAYLLDAFGDLGNKQQIAEAFERFDAAVREIESAFPAGR
jgi:hypothetical protein